MIGFDTTVGTAGVNATVCKRSIGIVDLFGNINTTAYINNGFTTDAPRSVVTTDGINFWASGNGSSSSGGIRYVTSSSSGVSTQLNSTLTNTRVINIFNGQVMASTGSGTSVRVFNVGTGLPTTSGQTLTNLPGIPTVSGSSPYSFYLADLDAGVPGYDVLYVCWDDANAFKKYSLVSGTWTLNGTIGIAADAYRGLTASVSGTTVTLFATRKGGSGATGGGELVTLVDASGYNGTFTGTPTVLATSGTNAAFRGIAFAPNSATISSNVSLNAGTYNNISINSGATVTLNGNITINGTLSFSGNSVLNTGANSLTLSATATNPNESPSNGRIIGNVNVNARTVGTGSYNYLGIALNSGTDDIGTFTVSRTTGSSGIITVGSNSGNAVKWTLTATSQPASGRDLTLSWVSNFDNGNVSPYDVWKFDGSAWNQVGSPQATSSDPRQVTINTTSFSQWTVSDDSHPLPVTMLYFNNTVAKNNVSLKWATSNEINNKGFEIYRFMNNEWKLAGFVNGKGTTNNLSEYHFEDKNLATGTYKYKLKQIDFNGNSEFFSLNSDVTIGAADKFGISQNFPNPFNPTTGISYSLSEDAFVNLQIYDITGRQVEQLVNSNIQAGYHTVTFDGSALASGVYFYRIRANDNSGKNLFTKIMKMLLVK
jgi:hypothetical protein